MPQTTYSGAKTALFLVDPYNDFLSEGRKVYPRIKAIADEVGLLDNLHLSLFKTVNYRESLEIFLGGRRPVGRHDHHSSCFRFHALVPVSQPNVARTRARRLATSADCLAAAAPSPLPESFRRPAPYGNGRAELSRREMVMSGVA